MARYHVNNKGDAGVCRAVVGKCPFGGDDAHYTSAAAARGAYEELMRKALEFHEVGWEDMTPQEEEEVSKQATAVRDVYFEDREVSSVLTHEHVFPVVKEWDDYLMGKHGDYLEAQRSFYENEGNIKSEDYTNSYDAKVRWLNRVAHTDYPLLGDIVLGIHRVPKPNTV